MIAVLLGRPPTIDSLSDVMRRGLTWLELDLTQVIILSEPVLQLIVVHGTG
jgi:hypothetical protein